MNLNDDQVYVLEHLKSKDPKLLRQLHKSGELEEYLELKAKEGPGDEEVPDGRQGGGEARREGDRERDREGATEASCRPTTPTARVTTRTRLWSAITRATKRDNPSD